MRALVLALFVISGTARAERIAVRTQVPLLEECGKPAPWARVTSCFTALYERGAKVLHRPAGKVTTTIVASTEHGRVVRVTSPIDSPTLVVLRELETGWQLIGILMGVDEVESIEGATIDGKRGLRIVRHEADVVAVELGDGTSVNGARRQRVEMFCDGHASYCETAVTACDVMVGGKTYQTFRGTLSFQGGVFHAAGDRSAAGLCEPTRSAE